MVDTELIIHCPLCGSLSIVEQRGMYATTMKVEKPGDPPEEVELKIFLCCQCGRTFNELEGRREE